MSDCVHDVYCNKIKAAVDSNEFESVNGDLSVKMNQNEVNLCPVELSTLKYVEVNVTCDGTPVLSVCRVFATVAQRLM